MSWQESVGDNSLLGINSILASILCMMLVIKFESRNISFTGMCKWGKLTVYQVYQITSNIWLFWLMEWLIDLQYSLFIRRYSCSATDIIFSKYYWSLLSLCFFHHVSKINSLYLFVNLILVLFLPFPTHIFLHQHFFLFWYTTLLIHNFFSFTPGLKPSPFHKSYPVVSLLAHGLPSRTFARTVSSELLGFCF